MPKEQVDLQKISSKELLCEVFVFSVHFCKVILVCKLNLFRHLQDILGIDNQSGTWKK